MLTRAGTIFFCGLVGFSAAQADEQAEREFYAGKTVSIYVGLPPGGTFDSYARLVGAHLSRFIPGNPSIVVQNMPGAGSIRAANHIYNAAPQDGTAIGAMSSNVPMQPLINPEGIQYDLRKVRWLPTPSRSVNTLVVWHTSPIKRFEDLRGQEAAVGTLAPGSSPTTAIGIYKHVLGAKIKAVLGYAGLPEAMLAMQRGEIEGYPTIPVDTLKRTYGALLKEGKLRVLTQNGDVRHPDLADVPTSKELAGSEEDRKLVGLATFTTQITLPYIMGPGVSDQRLQTMRAAMNAMFADPAFLKDAESRQLWIDPVGSDEVARIVGEAYDTSPAIVKRLQDIVALQGK